MRVRSLTASLLFVFAVFALVSAPALAATIVTLPLDPSQSELSIFDPVVPFGPVPLSGSLSISFDPDPFSAGTFTVVGLEATGPGGVVLSLDEDAGDPGSGVFGTNALVFQTPLVLDIAVVPGFSLPTSFAPPFGPYELNDAGTAVETMGIVVNFVELGNQQILDFTLVAAVPEPGGAALLGAGLVGVGLWRLRARRRLH